jgi:menaquinone-dependent protoporphyrinogen oxidase
VHVLVAYASRHGSTEGIAERIAETLRASGVDARALPAASVKKVSEYDAFVIGSAAYMFSWLKDAVALVRRNRGVLSARPVWLFSSGPLGTDPLDAKGRDQKVVTIPKEIPELMESVHAREHRVFFGAYQPALKPVGVAERLMQLMPAAKKALPAGDFRDWPEIEAWAAAIAHDLLRTPRPEAG